MNTLFKYFRYTLLALGFTLLFGACASDKKAELESLKKDRNAINEKIKLLEAELSDTSAIPSKKLVYVKVDTVSKRSFIHLVEVHGKVESDRNVVVSAQAAGTVVKVYVNRGQSVKKGTLLASIDNQILAKSIVEVQTQLALATDVYEKQKKLWEQNIGTEIQYLSAKTNKEALENKLETLNEQNELYRFKAPIDGVVDEVMVKEGQIAAPGVPAFRIVNSGAFKVIAEIGEGHMSSIREGASVSLFFPDLKKTLTSRISTVSQVINPLNRTFTVEAALPSSVRDVKANQIVYLGIKDYESAQAVVVPINLVQKSEGGYFIFIAENSKVVKRTVKLGNVYRADAEILDGLKEGDRLITVGYQELVEGQSVTY